MKKQLFNGAATALITPFKENGALDLNGLERLIEFQIEGNIQALILSGTTGEGSTLSFDEFSLLISEASRIIRHRIPLIAGTGSNNTATSLKLSLEAEKQGADGILLVTPYYNKTTQEGLVRHYFTVADRVDLPMLVYNVPARTGMTITADTCRALSQHPRILGIKEASGNISSIADIAAACSDFAIYSGNDDQILPILSLGGIGVISVLSNIAPREIQNICELYAKHETQKATQEQLRFLPLIRLLFSQVNPIPIKCAAQLIGLPAGAPRLPLISCSESIKKELEKAIRMAGL